jgi:hypothetical protein
MFKIEKATAFENKIADRISWPFRDMSVGDVVRIDDKKLQPKAQVMCHVYGRLDGMKFKTKTIDGQLNIWRIS